MTRMRICNARAARFPGLVIVLASCLCCCAPTQRITAAEPTSSKTTEWWSWRPLTRPEVPTIAGTLDRDSDFVVRNAIDAFILSKQIEHGLSPSGEADRRTQIRRLYFDLIGLPPSPDEVERFLHDSSPHAYEDLVDRLLASPHYGERWARHWLDVVKYADTCGYDKDKLRLNAWPYRDYVIRSFNSDKPYSRFVQEQIAGDVLFPGDPDGTVALGFIAAGPWDFIGHVEVPESKIDGKTARNIDRDEMVTNTLNTFNSVTIQCARCHDHKFDPITQQHYYSLQAVFAAVDRADRVYEPDPDVERRRAELNRLLVGLRAERQQLADQIRRAAGPELAEWEERIAELEPATAPRAKKSAFGFHSAIADEPDKPKWVQVDLGRSVSISRVVLRPCHDDFAGIGAGFGFPVRFRVELLGESGSGIPEQERLLADETGQDLPNPGLAPYTVDVAGASGRYVRVTATRLAERSGDYIFALAELEVWDESGSNRALGAQVAALDSIEAPVRWGRGNLTDGIWAEASDPAAAVALAEARQRRRALLARVRTPERVAQEAALEQRTQSATRELAALPEGKLVYAAATHFAPQGNFKPTMGNPRPVHVLRRGSVLDPGDLAHPGTIPLIPAIGAGLDIPEQHTEGDGRAALARWLIRRDHPLTWRSIVNRVWQYHFGRGLVDTPNDFGRMGQLPSHPELLDWLACELRDGGESFKALHRLIVTSSVYRQSSAYDAQKPGRDADNRYLWRMNRRRLEAEQIRDSILAVSGMLDNKMYGPGFFLFELEKAEHSPHYEYYKHDPEDRGSHRRAIFRFIVRSQPDPYMTTLDCADSSQSTPKRDETVTALQALALLNNRFNLAMARHFADRVESECATEDGGVVRAVQLALARRPTAEELIEMRAYAAQFGMANLCRLLFNLSEFVYVD